MNVELLNKRIEELKNNQAQLTANLNAISGALQDCSYWLSVLNAAAAAPAPATESTPTV